MLHTWQFGETGDSVVVGTVDESPQIKYLRVPDALLDSVKEDQMRMREAGRRGGPGARGMSLRIPFT